MSVLTIVAIVILLSALRWIAFPSLGVNLMMKRSVNVEKFDILEMFKIIALVMIPLILSQNHGLPYYPLVIGFLGYYTLKWVGIRLTYGEIGW